MLDRRAHRRAPHASNGAGRGIHSVLVARNPAVSRESSVSLMRRTARLAFPMLGALLASAFGLSAGDLRAEDAVGFNLDVLPILSDKCFACHGPDARKRQADLRLDVRETA